MSRVAGIRAGKIAVEAGLDDSRLQAGMRRAEKRLRAFGASVHNMGASMARMGATMALPFVASGKVFASFEQQMARVKAVSNDLSEEGFARLQKKAKDLGASTVFSASQAAEAMGNFALAGYDVETILSAVGPTLDLAAAGQIEIAEAADIAAKIMSGMGVEAADLGYAIDVMAKAMTTANTDLTMLGEAFKYVGPIAKTAGVSLEEITASIQLLSNAGVQGEMAGTTLRGIILSLTSPGEKAAKTLKRLGVAVKDARGNFRGMAAIIADFQRGMAGMGNAQQLEMLGTIFDARQAAGAAELINQGGGAIRGGTAALSDSAGTAARIASVQLDTLQGAVEIARSAIEGLAIEVGGVVEPAFRRFAERLSEASNAVAVFVQANRALTLNAFKATTAITATGAALVATGYAARVAAVGLRVLAVAMGVVTSPIALVVGLLGAAGFAFLRFTETGRRAFESLKGTATAAIGGIGNALKSGDIELAGKILWTALKLEWTKGVAFLRGQWDDFLIGLVNRTSSVTIPLVKFFVDAWAAIRSVFVEATSFLDRVWFASIASIESAWVGLSTRVITTWNSTVGVISGSMAALGVLVQPFVSAVTFGFNLISTVATTSFNLIVAAWTLTIKALSAAWGAATSMIGRVWGVVVSGIVGTWNMVAGALGSAFGLVADGAAAAWQFFGDIFRVVTGSMGVMAEFVFKGIAVAIMGVIEVVKVAVGWIGELLKSIGKLLGVDRAIAAFNDKQREAAEKNQQAREAAAGRQGAIGDRLGGQLGGVDADRQQRLDAIEANRQRQQEAAGNLPGTLTDAADARRAQADGEIARLESELKSALEEAAAKAAPKPEEVVEDAAAKSPTLDALTGGGLGSAVEQSDRKTDVKGSFSAAALRGLGVGDTAADRTAEATEESAELLRSIDNRVRQGGLAFE